MDCSFSHQPGAAASSLTLAVTDELGLSDTNIVQIIVAAVNSARLRFLWPKRVSATWMKEAMQETTWANR